MAHKSSRNPRWEREELILALDLYFENNPSHTSDNDPKICNLSNILRELNIPNTSSNLENFRNPNSVYMKLCNFLALDPEYEGVGLKRGSKLDQMVWNEFASNPDLLHKATIEILDSRKSQIKSKSLLIIVNHEINKKNLKNIISSQGRK